MENLSFIGLMIFRRSATYVPGSGLISTYALSPNIGNFIEYGLHKGVNSRDA